MSTPVWEVYEIQNPRTSAELLEETLTLPRGDSIPLGRLRVSEDVGSAKNKASIYMNAEQLIAFGLQMIEAGVRLKLHRERTPAKRRDPMCVSGHVPDCDCT